MKINSESLERPITVLPLVPLLLALMVTLLLTGSGNLLAQESDSPAGDGQNTPVSENTTGDNASREKDTGENGVRDKLFQIEDWSGYNLVTLLKDGTSLFSYVTETPSLPVESNGESSDRAEHNVIFRVTFFARFQCSPLIEMIGTMPEDTNEDTRVAVLRNFNQVSLSIDGERQDFPVFVEQKGQQVHSFYNANLEGRTTMRIFIEIGNKAIATFGDGTKASFSLQGSRKSIAQATGRCRSHQ